jgi:hypothetical protein
MAASYTRHLPDVKNFDGIQDKKDTYLHPESEKLIKIIIKYSNYQETQNHLIP